MLCGSSFGLAAHAAPSEKRLRFARGMTELVTIPGVPILRVGMGYPLASGKKTFTEEDIAAAANAYATDPAVKAPRIKIDAVAKAMGLDPEAHGGEPAFGWFDNLRVSEDGQELIADAHCPAWVRDAMEWAYPSLSVEGPPPGWTSPTGRTHELVITAVALLGTDWPGCTTLDDFRELLAKGPALAEEPDEVSSRAWSRCGPRSTPTSSCGGSSRPSRRAPLRCPTACARPTTSGRARCASTTPARRTSRSPTRRAAGCSAATCPSPATRRRSATWPRSSSRTSPSQRRPSLRRLWRHGAPAKPSGSRPAHPDRRIRR
jgi:hypothetical protein